MNDAYSASFRAGSGRTCRPWIGVLCTVVLVVFSTVRLASWLTVWSSLRCCGSFQSFAACCLKNGSRLLLLSLVGGVSCGSLGPWLRVPLQVECRIGEWMHTAHAYDCNCFDSLKNRCSRKALSHFCVDFGYMPRGTDGALRHGIFYIYTAK